MIISDFCNEGTHKIDTCTANNESPRSDTERVKVAMLSERLHSLGTPYIYRQWHRLTGTN